MGKQYHDNLIVSASPHAVNNEDTRRIMCLVMLALAPAFLVNTYVFGLRSVILTAVCIISCVLLEYLWNMLMKKPQTVGDCSAALTGLLLAYNLPANLPYYIAIVGAAVAIILVKCLFGGIGKNLFNPAITARVVLLVSFATQMTTWPIPRNAATDALTGPTPLGILKEGGNGSMPSNLDLFLGFTGGSLGEVSAVALLIGGLFLIWKKVISPITPVCFIGTVAIIALIAGQNPIFHVCAGGVMLGAFFMATDYVTTPLLPWGKVIFGIGCGVITMLVRLFGSYPEGVSFAILLMNVTTPLIERVTTNRLFKPKKKIKKGEAADEK